MTAPGGAKFDADKDFFCLNIYREKHQIMKYTDEDNYTNLCLGFGSALKLGTSLLN